MTTVAALLVTRDAARWLPALLDSIAAQSRQPDLRVAVDDGSTDGTRDLLRASAFQVVPSSTAATDTVTRIAHNFAQGVQACAACDVVVLGDHDDVWHRDRVAHQVKVLERGPEALLVASDGRIVDASGVPTAGTLRSGFPVPAGWEGMSPAQRMAAALRVSVATGGASAMRPAAFPDLDVPAGWLHDRWWSLVALARDGLVVDDRAVIDYRVQPGQEVGLDRAAQGAGLVGRVGALLRDGGRSWAKARDLRTRLRPLAATPAIAEAITVRNALRR